MYLCCCDTLGGWFPDQNCGTAKGRCASVQLMHQLAQQRWHLVSVNKLWLQVHLLVSMLLLALVEYSLLRCHTNKPTFLFGFTELTSVTILPLSAICCRLSRAFLLPKLPSLWLSVCNFFFFCGKYFGKHQISQEAVLNQTTMVWTFVLLLHQHSMLGVGISCLSRSCAPHYTDTDGSRLKSASTCVDYWCLVSLQSTNWFYL